MKRVLLALLLVLGVVRASAYDFTAVCPSGQTLYYAVRNAVQRTVAVVAPNNESYPPYQGYTRPEGAIELSETVEHDGTSYTLVEIGPYAFSYLSSYVSGDIVIPNTVTVIGKQAFAYSYFDGTITLGDHVVSIGNSAFSATYCHGSVVLPSTVRTLDDYAFSDNGYLDGELVLNEGLQRIGDRAFSHCVSLQGELRLPSTLTEMGEFCFAYCAGFTGNLVIPEGITVIPMDAFLQCSGLEHLTLHEHLTEIKSGGFESCSGLTGTLTLPASLAYMKSFAFAYCSGLSYLILQHDLNNCGYNCFLGCTGLTGNIVIPEGTTIISTSFFQNCCSIEHVTLPQTLTTIGSSAFSGCTGLIGDLQLPEGLRSIDNDAFWGCTGFDGTLTLPESLRYIEKQVFWGCTGFTGTLVIPDQVRSVGLGAFTGCTGLGPEADVGASVSMLDQCFSDTGITHVTFRGATPPTGTYGIGLAAGTASCTVPCGTTSEYQQRYGNLFSAYDEDLLFRYSVVSNDTRLGDVAIEETPNCDNDERLVAIATPKPEKVFSHWTVDGDTVGCSPRLTLTVDGDYQVVAHFLGGASVDDDAAPIGIYPTVTSGQVVAEGDGILGLEAYDLTGRRVAYADTRRLDLSALPSGTYLIRVVTTEGEARRKVVKM